MLKIVYIFIGTLLYCYSSVSFSYDNSITFDVANSNSTFSSSYRNQASVNSENKNNTIQLLLPIPNHKISLKSEFLLTQNTKKVEANIVVINSWSTIKYEKFIRILSIEVNSNDIYSSPITLSWVNSDKEAPPFNANQSSFSEIVYPLKSWFVQSILLHPVQTVDIDWYIEPQKKYANYVTNQALLAKKGYPATKASQWLYDRPQAIYQLFLMSGEKEWLTKANKLADFYISKIDEDGLFTLKKQFDPKLLMPKGVLYRYLLSGDVKAKQALQRMFSRSFDWDESYSLRSGFWTERNQAAALNVAVSYWELTNSAEALKRINDIIDATVAMTFNPENGWSLRGCPQHSFKSHEGWGDNSPACSPWMMALLGDALWRFYLLTEDKRAASLIDAFGDFILNHGIYYGDVRVKNIVIPKYIVSIENPKQEELNQWTDTQHACDVAALLGKSAYIKKQRKQDGFLMVTLFTTLLEQCSSSYIKWQHEQKKKQIKPYWVLKPPRRFGWMYSTTSDLPWLSYVLLGLDWQLF